MTDPFKASRRFGEPMTAGKVLRYALAGSIPARVIPVILGDFPLLDTVICGDCLEELPAIPEDSIDAIVTDPPAGIAFMGKEWDKDKGGRDKWIAWMEEIAFGCLRVVKPGGHALVWALPRTSHWTGMAWENAGWEPRDKIAHVFGSGFPKSLDISKAIDKMAGAEREVIGPSRHHSPGRKATNTLRSMNVLYRGEDDGKYDTAPATPAAIQWAGFGTALKPSHEDWWLFRKPLDQPTIAANVLRWGVGGINIDGCRIATAELTPRHNTGERKEKNVGKFGINDIDFVANPSALGRFPANLIWSHSPLCKRIGTKKVKGSQLDHVCSRKSDNGIYHPYGTQHRVGYTDADGMEEVESWDCHPSCPSWQFAKAGESKSSDRLRHNSNADNHEGYNCFGKYGNNVTSGFSDQGTPARFFQCCPFTEEDIPAFAYYAKASKSDRGEGNTHCTTKPSSLIQYLCKLICPPNGVILDPFGGSGTLAIAAIRENFHYILIEKEKEYIDICRSRVEAELKRIGPKQSDLSESLISNKIPS